MENKENVELDNSSSSPSTPSSNETHSSIALPLPSNYMDEVPVGVKQFSPSHAVEEFIVSPTPPAITHNWAARTRETAAEDKGMDVMEQVSREAELKMLSKTWSDDPKAMIDCVWMYCARDHTKSKKEIISKFQKTCTKLIEFSKSNNDLSRIVKSKSLTREVLIENLGSEFLTAEIGRFRNREAAIGGLTIVLKRPLAEKLYSQLQKVWERKGSPGELSELIGSFREFLQKRKNYRTALVKGILSVESLAAFTPDELAHPPILECASRKQEQDYPSMKPREIFSGKVLSNVDEVNVTFVQIGGKPLERLLFTRKEVAVSSLKIQGRLKIEPMRDYLKEVKKSTRRGITTFEVRPTLENFEEGYDQLHNSIRNSGRAAVIDFEKECGILVYLLSRTYLEKPHRFSRILLSSFRENQQKLPKTKIWGLAVVKSAKYRDQKTKRSKRKQQQSDDDNSPRKKSKASKTTKTKTVKSNEHFKTEKTTNGSLFNQNSQETLAALADICSMLNMSGDKAKAAGFQQKSEETRIKTQEPSPLTDDSELDELEEDEFREDLDEAHEINREKTIKPLIRKPIQQVDLSGPWQEDSTNSPYIDQCGDSKDITALPKPLPSANQDERQSLRDQGVLPPLPLGTTHTLPVTKNIVPNQERLSKHMADGEHLLIKNLHFEVQPKKPSFLAYAAPNRKTVCRSPPVFRRSKTRPRKPPPAPTKESSSQLPATSNNAHYGSVSLPAKIPMENPPPCRTPPLPRNWERQTQSSAQILPSEPSRWLPKAATSKDQDSNKKPERNLETIVRSPPPYPTIRTPACRKSQSTLSHYNNDMKSRAYISKNILMQERSSERTCFPIKRARTLPRSSTHSYEDHDRRGLTRGKNRRRSKVDLENQLAQSRQPAAPFSRRVEPSLSYHSERNIQSSIRHPQWPNNISYNSRQRSQPLYSPQDDAPVRKQRDFNHAQRRSQFRGLQPLRHTASRKRY